MRAEDFVREARSAQPGLPSPHLLQYVAYQEVSLPDSEERVDQNATFRMSVLAMLYETLAPGDHELIRFLLGQEIAYHESEDMWGMSESIRFCGFLLSTFAQVEDVRLLWEAKTTGFDTMCGFDVQFLVGAGVSTALVYLQHHQDEWALEAREYIEECQKAGDFRDLERGRAAMHAYFRKIASPE